MAASNLDYYNFADKVLINTLPESIYKAASPLLSYA